MLKKLTLFPFFLFCLLHITTAQKADSTDVMAQMEKEAAQNETNYTIATFKSTRLINGHTVETLGKNVLDVRFSHRFGTINRGAYELFGLDNATTRIGLDYGITPWLMAGIGRSSYQKTFDGLLKVRILRQSAGKRKMPVTVSYLPTMAIRTLHWEDPERKNYFSSRLSYTHQLLIARKFSEGTSLQLMPTFIHRNLAVNGSPNDTWAIGIGGRQKITRRTAFTAEYYYQFPNSKIPGTTNSLSFGFDIETGGHVFQLHFTNSLGMTEKAFIGETTGKWDEGDILFGFNISRVFNIGKNH